MFISRHHIGARLELRRGRPANEHGLATGDSPDGAAIVASGGRQESEVWRSATRRTALRSWRAGGGRNPKSGDRRLAGRRCDRGERGGGRIRSPLFRRLAGLPCDSGDVLGGRNRIAGGRGLGRVAGRGESRAAGRVLGAAWSPELWSPRWEP